MKFNNKRNEFVTKDNIGERGFFMSRSIAVLGTILVKCDNEIYVLINKRGTAMDFPNLYNMPCGYLDWNESATEAIYREVYEECGLDLNELKCVIKSDLEQPWYVHHAADGNRQNITLIFGLYCIMDKLPELTSEFSEDNEVQEVKWFNVKNINTRFYGKFDWAFNHDKILCDYLDYINKYL
jgi:ADP-ribose pyrophosphatase YjhB (NUDIX family)